MEKRIKWFKLKKSRSWAGFQRKSAKRYGNGRCKWMVEQNE